MTLRKTNIHTFWLHHFRVHVLKAHAVSQADIDKNVI